MTKLILLLAFCSITFGKYINPRTRLDNRIVGGKLTTIEDHPYQVSLQYYGGHTCGGSLIFKTVVLTAAHCVFGNLPEEFSVRLGSSVSEDGGSVIDVKDMLIHPEYNYRIDDYDVALIYLKSEAALSEGVQIVGIATEEPKVGTKAVVTGWGKLSSTGPSTNKLYEVTVPTISLQQCKEQYPREEVTERMLCAGYESGGKDACQGDSGGPLVANGVQIGIVSWGYSCAAPGYPGVYANVPNLHDWIVANSGL